MAFAGLPKSALIIFGWLEFLRAKRFPKELRRPPVLSLVLNVFCVPVSFEFVAKFEDDWVFLRVILLSESGADFTDSC